MRSPAAELGRMTSMVASWCTAFVLTVLVAVGTGHAAEAPPEPFADAVYVPADVDVFLNVVDAAQARQSIAARPLGRLMLGTWRDGALAPAWDALAAAEGSSPGTLFDTWFGRRFTLVARSAGGEPGRSRQWAMLTDIDTKQVGATFARLGARRLMPRGNVAVVELPEHEIRVARAAGRFIIGPIGDGDLFFDVLGRLSDPRRRMNGGALSTCPRFGAALDLVKDDDRGPSGGGDAPVSTFAYFGRLGLPDGRPEPGKTEAGSWSALIGDLDDDQVRVRHLARFAAPPFDRPVTEISVDWSVLDPFERRALTAMVEPTDIGGGPLEAFAEAFLRTPMVSPATRDRFGDRRVFAIGEREGRMEAAPADMLIPTAAMAVEIEDDPNAVGHEFNAMLDADLERFGHAINRLVQVPPDPRAPRRPSGLTRHPNGVRQLDLAPVMNELSGQLPVLRTVSLNWTVTRGPHGAWCVIATHPDELARTVAALQAAPSIPPRRDRITGCGTMNGQRVGAHLRTYADQASMLAEPDAEEEFRRTMHMLANLAEGIERCRWQLRRPSTESMSLDLQVTLRASESQESNRPRP